MKAKLNMAEIEALFQQDPDTRSHGGFQNFLIGLQNKVDQKTGEIELSERDIERIRRYASEYGGGGWEKRLVQIFGRALGKNLGR